MRPCEALSCQTISARVGDGRGLTRHRSGFRCAALLLRLLLFGTAALPRAWVIQLLVFAMLPRQHLLLLLVTPRHIRSGLLNGRAKYFKISDSLLREQACCGSRAELLLLALLLAFHQLALLGLQNPFREGDGLDCRCQAWHGYSHGEAHAEPA